MDRRVLAIESTEQCTIVRCHSAAWHALSGAHRLSLAPMLLSQYSVPTVGAQGSDGRTVGQTDSPAVFVSQVYCCTKACLLIGSVHCRTAQSSQRIESRLYVFPLLEQLDSDSAESMLYCAAACCTALQHVVLRWNMVYCAAAC